MGKADDGAKTSAHPLPLDPCADLCLHRFLDRLPLCTFFLIVANSILLSVQPCFKPPSPLQESIMAPTRTKKARSPIETTPTARLQTVTLQSPAKIPVQSTQNRSFAITEGQKQALIDNLQLESEYSGCYGTTQALTSFQSRNAREN